MISKASIHHKEKFDLEVGGYLPGLKIAYHTFGTYRPGRRNVVWVCHALTANSDVFDWWKGFFGPDCYFNPEEHYIVCANILGSCYGTTGPLNTNPETGEPYYLDFPAITTRDMVRAHILLADHLGIDKIDILIGGSLGGQQVMEWAIMEPGRIRNSVLIATNARHSPWGIAFNETQRMALQLDPTFGKPGEQPVPRQEGAGEGSFPYGSKGLETARAIAMLSYRCYRTYDLTQSDESDEILDGYRATTYQRYQGYKLAKRFNAYSYWVLSKTMDMHHVGRGRGGLEAALGRIRSNTLVIGLVTDVLFPLPEQQLLAKTIPGAVYKEIDSVYGHDGFLIETQKLGAVINEFLTTRKAESHA